MTDIFISYKREDRDIAERVAQAFLRRGYAVWWDASLLAGDVFAEEINRQLGAARIAITLWSEAARQSKWVGAESLAAWDDGKYLGAMIEPDVKLSVPFNSGQNEDLTGLATGESDLVRLVQTVEARIGPPPHKPIDDSAAEEELRASEAEAAIWFKIHDSRDPDAFRFYLDQYGEDAKFAAEARRKIKSLGRITGRITRTGGRGLGLVLALSAIVAAGALVYQAIRPSDNALLAEARVEIRQLEADSGNASDTIDTLERDMDALRQQLEAKEIERQSAVEERDDAKAAEKKQVEQISILLQEKEEMLTEARAEIRQREADNLKSLEEIKSLKRDIADLRQKLDIKEVEQQTALKERNDVQESDAQIESLQRVLEIQRERSERVADIVTAQRIRIAELESNIIGLRRIAKTMESKTCQSMMDEAVQNDIPFENNKSEIIPDAALIIDDLVKISHLCDESNLIIRGHTDSMGERSYNIYLSELRAAAVVDYMVQNGVAPSRVSSVGVGPDEPIADNRTRAGRAQNRRIEIVVD